ncbi:MAG TPA: MOSC N-terminal beta barrel domain-containing protein, partial [Brevundimonas sp.]|nr:MOSC N-terminal beta barrel domain-containing protein [Brevundimonas sp.]
MAETRIPAADGVVTALWRHPVKGFTPEPLDAVDLPTGGWFPGDRMFAVEDGPSGFDRAAPEHLPKQKFTVLMRTAEVAGVRTRWDETARTLHAAAAGQTDISVAVDDPDSRAAFESWLAAVLGDAVSGPLRLVSAEGLDHRFMD